MEFINFKNQKIEGIIKCRNTLYHTILKKFIKRDKEPICYDLVSRGYISNDDKRSDLEIINQYITDIDAICNVLSYNPIEMAYNTNNICKNIIYDRIGPNNVFEIDDIDQFETDRFSTCIGEINYKNVDYKGNVDELMAYDANSYYGYLLTSFPIMMKKGYFKTVNNLSEIDKYTFAYILVGVDKNTLPFYYKDVKCDYFWITHYDLQIFQMMNVSMKIREQENNYYFYEKMVNTRLYDSVVKKLYDLKLKTGNKAVKLVLSRIQGCVIEKHQEYTIREKMNDAGKQTVPVPSKNFMLPPEERVITSKYQMPKHDIGRSKAFFYAYSRYMTMKKVINLIKEGIEIYRIKTDSITCKKNEIMDKLVSDKLGGLKYEKVDLIKI